jgi:hypothetical protein
VGRKKKSKRRRKKTRKKHRIGKQKETKKEI